MTVVKLRRYEDDTFDLVIDIGNGAEIMVIPLGNPATFQAGSWTKWQGVKRVYTFFTFLLADEKARSLRRACQVISELDLPTR